MKNEQMHTEGKESDNSDDFPEYLILRILLDEDEPVVLHRTRKWNHAANRPAGEPYSGLITASPGGDPHMMVRSDLLDLNTDINTTLDLTSVGGLESIINYTSNGSISRFFVDPKVPDGTDFELVSHRYNVDGDILGFITARLTESGSTPTDPTMHWATLKSTEYMVIISIDLTAIGGKKTKVIYECG